MEVPQLYSVLYFVMLLMLGIGSMLGNTAAILTPLTDSKLFGARFPKEVISGKRPPAWRSATAPVWARKSLVPPHKLCRLDAQQEQPRLWVSRCCGDDVLWLPGSEEQQHSHTHTDLSQQKKNDPSPLRKLLPGRNL